MTSVARTWKYLLPVLELAFPVRAAIALSGNFVLHPNEISPGLGDLPLRVDEIGGG